MEFINCVIVCLVFIPLCFAVDNQTETLKKDDTHIHMDLEQQSNMQKREKHYLLEDDPCEGPEQKREERQSIPGRSSVSEPKVQTKPLKIRLQPKILPSVIKPLKQVALPKRIDTTPQRIPTKMPVVLKNAKVIPAPAHALRLRMLENRLNDSVPNNEINLNATSENDVSFRNGTSNIEENHLKTESRSNEGEVLSNQKKEPVNKVVQSKDGQPNLNEDEKNIKNKEFLSKPEQNLKAESPDSSLKVSPKPNPFFLDEADPVPDRTQIDVSPSKTKEIPITKSKDHVDQTEHDSDFVQISNGTHLITIKKIGGKERHKMQHILTRDEFDEPQYGLEERIMNEPTSTLGAITQNPPYYEEDKIIVAGVALKDPKNKDQSCMKITISDGNKEDPNDCITITNHGYEEYEEITMCPPPPVISACDVANQGTLNYYQPLQSHYCNPYQNNVYDQFKKYYQMVQSDPNSYSQTFTQNNPNSYGQAYGQNNVNSYNPTYGPNNPNSYSQTYGQNNVNSYNPTYGPNNPNSYSQTYGQNNVKSYNPTYGPNNPNSYSQAYAQNDYETQTQNEECNNIYFPGENLPNYDECKAELDPYTYADYRTDSTLDRIWRTWKDVEIKIRKAQTTDEPSIDIRRTGEIDAYNGEIIPKLPIAYATPPIGVNGYYNNQNSAVMYPYMNLNRYMR